MSREQIEAQVAVIRTIGELIADLGEVPSGHIYAAVQGMMSLAQYQMVVDVLKRSGLVSEKAHLLTWIGPAKPKASN